MTQLPNSKQQYQRVEREQIKKLLQVVTDRLSVSEDQLLFDKKLPLITFATSHCRTKLQSPPCVMSVKKWLLYVIIITLLIFATIVLLVWLLNKENHYLQEDDDANNEEVPHDYSSIYSKLRSNLSDDQQQQLPRTIPPILALSQSRRSSMSTLKNIRHDWQACKLYKLSNSGDDKLIDFVSDDNRIKIVLAGRILIYSGQENLIGSVPLNEIETISTEELDSLMPSVTIKFTCATIDLHFVQLERSSPLIETSNKRRALITTNERQYFVQPIGGEVSYQLDTSLDNDIQSIETIKWSDVARVSFKFQQNTHYYCNKPWKSLTSRNKKKHHHAELQLHYLEYEIYRSPETDYNKFETPRGK